ncbi:hypothetical protein [Leucobacter triazinivorans]|uniref:Uncharacterized protein n=1 Tax=Leucobacter triazinivorans TaxID=1784719 RepID=A0A4P6KFK2_9MICO|nr:hypothetical protein [Leucobacter triazinivorans]QBE48761.1 hypothetical protein EVS81_07880 [Leucobacter triazinivorans]
MSTPTALTRAADKLADLMLKSGEQGVMMPEDTISTLWAVIGVSYTTARHPESAPEPIPGMVADLDRWHAALSKTLADHNRRTNR